MRDCCDHECARAVLPGGEGLYRTLFMLAPGAVALADDEGRLLAFNDRAHQELGYTREEFARLGLADLCSAEKRPTLPSRIARGLEAGGDEFECQHRTRSGELRHVLTRFRPVEIRGARCLLATWQDITDSKRAAEALRESEEKLTLAFEAANMGTWQSVPWGPLECSPRCREVFGLAPDASIDSFEEFLRYVHPDDRASHTSAVLASLDPAGDGEFHDQYRWVRPDGSVRWIASCGKARFAEVAGIRQPVFAAGAVLDVTESRQEEQARARLTAELERELAERKRIEKELLERVEMAALTADVGMAATHGHTLRDMLQRCAEAIVRRLGAAFARIWVHGPEPGVLVLQSSAGLYTHVDGAHGRVPIGALKIGRIAEEQRPLLTNDVPNDPLVDREWARREGILSFAGHPLVVGGKLVGVMAMFARQPLSDVATKGLACIADAIAVAIERGLAEVARASLEEQFRQAQKLESIGRLAGGIAHDFNNLLTVILSGAEELKRGLEEGAVLDAEIVGEIGAAGGRARELTRQLLAFARRQVIAPVPVDLNALVRRGEKLLRCVLGEDVELAATLQPALWPVRCDPGQMEQVLLNLAVNARDAMPSGGKLTIETSNLDVDASHGALFPGIEPGPYVRLAMHDCGIGMSPEVKARLFEPFFTTKPAGKGTGLGLATVYGIVNQNGGFIRVESEPGCGATFELLFPRTDQAAVAAAPPAAVGAARGTETVLVVEDDLQVREVTVRSLRAGGYLVLAAGGGREALDLLAREGAQLHLLVTDVVMQGLDGRALADELRRRHPELRVLYVSGHAEDAILERGVLEPGVAFLPKPFTASSLLARVRAVLDRPPTGLP
jgi:PAS domain S-box-containing protein